MNSSRRFQTIRYHSEVRVFSGGGWSEILVYLPKFATSDDLEEMREDLKKIGFATRQPFSSSSLPAEATGTPDGMAIVMKIQADDVQTLETLISAKNAFNSCAFPSE